MKKIIRGSSELVPVKTPNGVLRLRWVYKFPPSLGILFVSGLGLVIPIFWQDLGALCDVGGSLDPLLGDLVGFPIYFEWEPFFSQWSQLRPLLVSRTF